MFGAFGAFMWQTNRAWQTLDVTQYDVTECAERSSRVSLFPNLFKEFYRVKCEVLNSLTFSMLDVALSSLDWYELNSIRIIFKSLFACYFAGFLKGRFPLFITTICNIGWLIGDIYYTCCCLRDIVRTLSPVMKFVMYIWTLNFTLFKMLVQPGWLNTTQVKYLFYWTLFCSFMLIVIC